MFGGRTSLLTGVFTDFYNFDEAANNANAHDYVGSQDLTQHGNLVRAVGFNSVPFSKTFNSSNPDYYNVLGSSIFNTGDIDFAFCGWFYQNTADFSSSPKIFGKGTAGNEYAFNGSFSAGHDILTWRIFNNAAASMTITSPGGASLALRWIWYYLDHSATNDTFRMYLRDSLGATIYDSGNVATTIDPVNGTEDFIVGLAGNYSSFAFKGFQASMGYKKSGVLTTAQMNAHFNAGNGVTAPGF